MNIKSLFSLIFKNLVRSKNHIIFSSIGLVIGTGTLSFFIALSAGIKENVLNKIYPVNQVEMEPESVSLMGLKKRVEIDLNDETLKLIGKIKGVNKIYPKQRSKFQARLWGGKEIFGYDIRVEAFFDGIPSELIKDELKINEIGEEWEKKNKRCNSVEDCDEGEKCLNGFCKTSFFYEQFKDNEEGYKKLCQTDENCLVGESCRDIRCESDKDCYGDGKCENHWCVGIKICERIRCLFEDRQTQFTEDEEKLKGKVIEDCENGKGLCIKGGCPKETYCAAQSLVSAEGFCEEPIPVVLSPFLFEVYNNVAATALGLQRISAKELLLGFKFNILFGESYFIEDEKIEKRVKKICKIVGFSNKAMEFGITMPLPYVLRANERMKGKESASQYSSIIITTNRNEDIPHVIEEVEKLGLTLSSKSREGKKAGNMLLILTIIFSAISLIILSISAINITHTFLMIIYERKKEIGVFRAVGASMWNIRFIILGEALILGAFGGISGVILSFGGSRFVNTIIKNYLHSIPFKPEDFFIYHPYIIIGGIIFAVIFAITGAIIPSNHAAKMQPAKVLSEEG